MVIYNEGSLTMKYSLNKMSYLAVLAFLLFAGCSGGRQVGRHADLRVPAGVDSSVAIRADSMATHLFVSLQQEERANSYKHIGRNNASHGDSLWTYLEQNVGRNVSASDSMKAIEAFNRGARDLQELAGLEQNSQGMNDAVLRAKVLMLLENARKNFEQAVILNPFDVESRSWLAQVYQSLASRFLDESNYDKAVDILENLVRIEKGEHALFARLAEAYYAREDWMPAYDNFARAETVLRRTSGMDFVTDSPQTAALDTSSLFYYVYYQGDTRIKMHQADTGLHDLNRALLLTSTPQDVENINGYIDWIGWDGGNTRAVELRDSILELQDQGDYRKAARGYLKLLPLLQTQRAADEVTWRLAGIEYQHLEDQNKGVERLLHVVKRTPVDDNGAPLDSTYQRYFDSYGAMCHNLGLEHMRKDRKVAFTYFQQAVAIEWESRAKSQLEVAKLSRNNAKAVIAACTGALKQPDQLSPQEQMQVYQLLVEGYKRNGNFDEARRLYARWVELRRNSSTLR